MSEPPSDICLLYSPKDLVSMMRIKSLWDRLYSTFAELAPHNHTVHRGLVYFSEVFPFLTLENNSITHKIGIWKCVRCKAAVVADGWS